MSQMHRVAAQGFGREAAAYDRARPSYPPGAVARCVEQFGIRPGRPGAAASPDGVATRGWTERALATGTASALFTEATVRHEQDSASADVVERVRGVSHVAVLPQPEQEAVLGEVRGILDRHPDTRGRDRLTVPYRVDCLLTERR